MIYLIFVIGTLFGSFFLLLGTRLPIKERVIFDRSKCDYCEYVLKWYNLIPIISYVIQRGKCSNCNKRLGIEYLLSEIFTGVGFSLLYYYFGFGYIFFGGIIIYSLLIIIIVSDLKYFIILDSPLVIASILFIINHIVYIRSFNSLMINIVSGVSMFLLMYGIKIMGDKMFKRESLGGGDIKLSFVIGLILGFRLGLVSLVLSSFLALPASTLSIFNKNKEVPFGPFLCGSLFIVFIFMDKFINMINYFIR